MNSVELQILNSSNPFSRLTGFRDSIPVWEPLRECYLLLAVISYSPVSQQPQNKHSQDSIREDADGGGGKGNDGKLVEGEGFLKPLNQNKYPLIRPISVFQWGPAGRKFKLSLLFFKAEMVKEERQLSWKTDRQGVYLTAQEGISWRCKRMMRRHPHRPTLKKKKPRGHPSEMKIQTLHHHNFLPFLIWKITSKFLNFSSSFDIPLILIFNKLKPQAKCWSSSIALSLPLSQVFLLSTSKIQLKQS